MSHDDNRDISRILNPEDIEKYKEFLGKPVKVVYQDDQTSKAIFGTFKDINSVHVFIIDRKQELISLRLVSIIGIFPMKEDLKRWENG